MLNIFTKFTDGLKREVIYDLLQPVPLSGSVQETSRATLRAALQLGLVDEMQGFITLNSDYKKNKSVKENILRYADQKVLSNLEVELYLALFYAYYIGLNKEVYQRSNFRREDWAIHFNRDVFNNELQDNPFNATKHTGLDRWFGYLGLGWYDSNDNFQANPYERLLRSLPTIFDGQSKLSGDQFMVKLANTCPELDGGEIFLKANQYRNYRIEDKQCTLGLSHALVDLHEDKIIQLDCPIDSRGWNIEIAKPSRDDTIQSDRITLIKYFGK